MRMVFPKMILPKPGRALRPLVPRIFAVLAASFLLAALALATLAPMDMSLAEAVRVLDATLVAAMRTRVTGMLGNSVWQSVAVPFLVRPLWLVPACLGLICAGVAVSLSLPPPRPSHRRRS